MSKEDYGPLVERIRTKLTSWNVKLLSYADRVMLIASVIMSLVNFWEALFPLPKAYLEDIQGLCASFLWDGPNLNRRKVKISWENLCYPKIEGGLGFRSLQDTGKVNILKLIWRLLSITDSLWADWVRDYMLKENSLCSDQIKNQGSWIFKKMLKMRRVARDFHRMEIVSGKQTSFWYDNWSERGPLYEKFGNRGTMELGIPIEATVYEACLNYRTRRHRMATYREILEEISALVERVITQSGLNDIHIWKVSSSTSSIDFSKKRTWTAIRKSQQDVTWAKSVWFKGATPKQAFIHWMTCLDRLSTKNKIKRWNNTINANCILCNLEEESREHLFFTCAYSSTIWNILMRKLMGEAYSTSWDRLQTIGTRYNRDKIKQFLYHYGLQTAIYSIWLERNRRCHGIERKNPRTLAEYIRRIVKNRILAGMEGDNIINSRIMITWFRFE